MDLRAAEISKSYAKLTKRDYDHTLTESKLVFDTSDESRSEVSISYAPGVAVVTGGNGAGKTTLLQSIRQLSQRDSDSSSLPKHVRSATLSGQSGAVSWSVLASRLDDGSVSLEKIGDEIPEILYLDPSEETLRLARSLSEDDNVSDLIAGIDAAPLERDWLQKLSLILKKDYAEILCYEISELADHDEPVPWFVATASGVTYDSLSMGRGELSATYMLWKLSRMSSDALVVLEEPENHLASHSQAKLMDVLVDHSVKSGSSFVISSHSPAVFRRLPNGSVSLVRSTPKPEAVTGRTSTYVADALGLPLELSVALMVEDRVAAALVSELISRLDRPVLSGVALYFAADGESGVRSTLKQLLVASPTLQPLTFVGVLDGDQKTKRLDGDGFLYLPGSFAPEAVLRNILVKMDTSIDGLAEHSTSASAEELSNAFADAAGTDLHDWIEILAAALGGHAFAIRDLVTLALTDATFKDEAESFVDEVRSLLAR